MLLMMVCFSLSENEMDMMFEGSGAVFMLLLDAVSDIMNRCGNV